MIAGEDGARLGQPVSLQDQDAGRVEELRDLRARAARPPTRRSAVARPGPRAASRTPGDRRSAFWARRPAGSARPSGPGGWRGAPRRGPSGRSAGAPAARPRPPGGSWRTPSRTRGARCRGSPARPPGGSRKPLQAFGERGGQAQADPEEALHPGERVREGEEEEMDVTFTDVGRASRSCRARRDGSQCVWTTPFGAPVVPEVYTIVATLPGLMASRRASSPPGGCVPRPSARRPSQSSTRRRVPPDPWADPSMRTTLSRVGISAAAASAFRSCCWSSTNSVRASESRTM